MGTTAARIYQPHGTLLTLDQYVSVIRHFANLFSPPDKKEADNATEETADAPQPHSGLRDQLERYEAGLMRAKLSDERVRRLALRNGAKYPLLHSLRWLAYRFASAIILFGLSTPGALLWVPIAIAAKYRERQIIKKGIFAWYDTVSESKMLTGFLFAIVYLIIWGRHYPLILVTMWFSLRFIEDAMASWRSGIMLWRLIRAPHATLDPLIALRNALEKDIQMLAESTKAPAFPHPPERAFFNGGWRDIVNDNLAFFSPLRRHKQDWNETLRLRYKLPGTHVASAKKSL